MGRPKPLVVISIDGVGVAPPSEGNAVTLANTTNLDSYWPRYPHTYLEASGLNVGLPSGVDGNSEVGHMTMGSGKIIFQNLPRIDNAINNESFYSNQPIKDAFNHANKNKSNLHIIGLVGEGMVHSSTAHLYALIEFAIKEKFDSKRLFVHAFTDGRDSPPNSGIDTLGQLELFMAQRKMGKISTIVGRAYAMDRNRNWERTKKAYECLVSGNFNVAKKIQDALKDSYKNGIFDEYIEPIGIGKTKEEVTLIKDNDAVIFFNFRPDRAVQLSMAFEDDNFTGWQRTKLQNMFFVGMTDYEEGFPKVKAFPPELIEVTLGKVLSQNGLTQLRIAESEKFPHVTYFFNGGNAESNEGEDWVEVPSPSVPTYDLKPTMSQELATDELIKQLEENKYDFALINFAAPDMVAHTGNLKATILAMENTDKCIGKIVDYVLSKDGAVVITADHGNAEEMIDLKTGEPDTKHSVNQVPLILIQKGLDAREIPIGTLADVTPTVIKMLELTIPPSMTGRNLLG